MNEIQFHSEISCGEESFVTKKGLAIYWKHVGTAAFSDSEEMKNKKLTETSTALEQDNRKSDSLNPVYNRYCSERAKDYFTSHRTYRT